MADYKKIVTIGGKPGLYEIQNQRPDGLIVKSLIDAKTQFVSSRLHHFTLLENISIYTQLDSEPLYDIFEKMGENDSEIPEAKSSSNDLKAFFIKILPDYDEERVYVSDIKKVIKWYRLLQNHELSAMISERKKDYKEFEGKSEDSSSEEE